jgi:hypothetical protein
MRDVSRETNASAHTYLLDDRCREEYDAVVGIEAD